MQLVFFDFDATERAGGWLAFVFVEFNPGVGALSVENVVAAAAEDADSVLFADVNEADAAFKLFNKLGNEQLISGPFHIHELPRLLVLGNRLLHRLLSDLMLSLRLICRDNPVSVHPPDGVPPLFDDLPLLLSVLIQRLLLIIVLIRALLLTELVIVMGNVVRADEARVEFFKSLEVQRPPPWRVVICQIDEGLATLLAYIRYDRVTGNVTHRLIQ